VEGEKNESPVIPPVQFHSSLWNFNVASSDHASRDKVAKSFTFAFGWHDLCGSRAPHCMDLGAV
jgi:hypothetical protein